MLNRKIKTEYNSPGLVVKSQKLAGWLMQQGFKLHEMRPDKIESHRNVFIFTDSEQVHAAIQIFKRKYRS